jgi:hypothetical protein
MRNLIIIGALLISGCKIQFRDPPKSNMAEINYNLQACQEYCCENGTTMSKLEGTTCNCNNQKGPVFDRPTVGE